MGFLADMEDVSFGNVFQGWVFTFFLSAFGNVGTEVSVWSMKTAGDGTHLWRDYKEKGAGRDMGSPCWSWTAHVYTSAIAVLRSQILVAKSYPIRQEAHCRL